MPLAQRFEELLNLRVSEPEARLQESLEEAALMEERARAALEGMKAQLMQRDRDIAKMQREMETLRQEMKAQKAEGIVHLTMFSHHNAHNCDFRSEKGRDQGK